MDYIDPAETLLMKYHEENTQRVKSPPLAEDITLHIHDVFRFINQHASDGNYSEILALEQELKKILRCVWTTKWNCREQPDFGYLDGIKQFVKHHCHDHNDDLFLENKRIFIRKNSTVVNQDDFILLNYALFPHMTFSKDMLTDDLWDIALFILKNLILSININKRKQLKELKMERLKEATTDEERKEIDDEYIKDINDTKNSNIFLLIDHLNWCHANRPSDLLWRFVLMRWSAIDGDKSLDELIPTNEDEAKELVNYYLSRLDSDEESLVKLYIAINIYEYHHIHHDLEKYLHRYIEIMTEALVHRVKSLDAWKKECVKNITKCHQTLRLVMNDDDIIDEIIATHFQLFNVRTNMLAGIIRDVFDKEVLERHSFEKIVSSLKDRGEILGIMNKFTKTNDMSSRLDAFDVDLVEDVFMDKCTTITTSFTPFPLLYLKKRDKGFKDKLFAFMMRERYSPDTANNVSMVETLACLSIVMLDNRYFLRIQESGNTNLLIDYIIAAVKFISYMNPVVKNALRNTAKRILDSDSSLRGFRKFNLEDAVEALAQ